MEPLISLVNGQQCEQISIQDRGFNYGDGIFTTLKVKQGCPLFLSSHLERLSRDSSRLALPSPDVKLLTAEIKDLAQIYSDCVLKIVLTRGVAPRGYFCSDSVPTRALIVYPEGELPFSKTLVRYAVLRVCKTTLSNNLQLAGVKHLNRLEQVLGRNEWRSGEFDEGVMLDQNGYVIEGTMSNIFCVRSGVLTTPLISQCGILGVMRGQVISIANTLKLPMVESQIRLEDLLWAEELFITNSLVGIWPVKQLGEKKYGSYTLAEECIKQLDQMVLNEVRLWNNNAVYSPAPDLPG